MEVEQPAGRSMKYLTENALEANKAHQYALTKYAERLTAELQEMDKLMSAVNVEDGEDEPVAEIQIPGAKKAAGPCPPSEFLNPDSPFFEDASRRTRYINQTTAHTMKAKELEALAEAVRGENQRLQALESQKGSQGLSSITIDLENNTEGIDWAKVAEKVSTSSNIKRTADQCRIKWIGDRHPMINHRDWTQDELDNLSEFVHTQIDQNEGKVDWVEIASQLGTNRTPVDCMRHGFPRQRHTWNHTYDQKLLDAVQQYGTDNWSVVARVVSEDATSAQCQGRYYRALDPSIKRGPWSEAELARLKVATEAYGNNWMEIAACIPGRTNEQCRDRWTEHVNMFIGKEAWTEDEDEALIDAVKTMGNQWKAISVKLGKERTGAQCRLRYEKLKKQKNLQNQVGTSSSVAQSDENARTGTTAPVPKAKLHAGKSSVAPATPAGTVDGSEPPAAPIPRARPKPRPVGRKGKEKADVPTTFAKTEISTSPEGDEIGSTQGKRSAAHDLGEAPPSKKKKMAKKNAPSTDTHPQTATGAANTSKKSRNQIQARRGVAAPTSHNEASQSDLLSLGDAQGQIEGVTEPGVGGSNTGGKLELTLKVSPQPSQTPMSIPGNAPPHVPRPRGRPKKVTTLSTLSEQSDTHAIRVDPPVPQADAEATASSAPGPNLNLTPKPKGRKKTTPLPASNPENATNLPKTEPPTQVPPRRQSARVAAKK